MGMQAPRRLAVIGAGWAGIASAVRATQAGHHVTVFEMAPRPGGRARSVEQDGQDMDNGQHILIGAYARTLDLMRSVGVDSDRVLERRPLSLVDARGRGLRLPPGAALPAFLRGVWAHRGWRARERLSLLARAGRWSMGGFRCVPDRPVSALCAGLPARVRDELIDPLCVAALNTSSDEASAAVFLRVLRDAMFSGPGSADLLLPRVPLGLLLPEAACRWLEARHATVRLSTRVQRLVPGTEGGWTVDGEPFDAVVLACSAREAARLAGDLSPSWSKLAAAFAYEPIITAWIDAPRVNAPFPMIALAGGPAQFAFDLGALGQQPGRMSLVVSGARHWVEAGQEAFAGALRQQVDQQLSSVLPQGWRPGPVITEKRATFRCTPGLARPGRVVAPGLVAAGDYVDGPYPATLEGAVRAGEAALEALASRA